MVLTGPVRADASKSTMEKHVVQGKYSPVPSFTSFIMLPSAIGAVSLVRMAHMPGNYELYEPETNSLGPAVCKLCWERFEKKNTALLRTVWVSYKDRPMVWWLCGDCAENVKAGGYRATVFLKSTVEFIRSPSFVA